MTCNYQICHTPVYIAHRFFTRPTPCINNVPITKEMLIAEIIPGIPNWDCSSSCIQALTRAYQFYGLNPPDFSLLCPSVTKTNNVNNTTSTTIITNNSSPQPANVKTAIPFSLSPLIIIIALSLLAIFILLL